MSEIAKKKKKHKTFKVRITNNQNASGYYKGDSPYQAASKAFSYICRMKEKAGESVSGKISFELTEYTKGKRNKVHNYIGKRVKLKKPIEYEIKKTGKELVKNFKNVIRKVKKCDLKNFKLSEESWTKSIKIWKNE